MLRLDDARIKAKLINFGMIRVFEKPSFSEQLERLNPLEADVIRLNLYDRMAEIDGMYDNAQIDTLTIDYPSPHIVEYTFDHKSLDDAGEQAERVISSAIDLRRCPKREGDMLSCKLDWVIRQVVKNVDEFLVNEHCVKPCLKRLFSRAR